MFDFCIVIEQIKPVNGVTVQAIQRIGVPVFDFSMYDTFKKYKNIVIFYNKIPPFFELSKSNVAWWMCDLRKPQEIKNPYNNNQIYFDRIFLPHKTYDSLYDSEFNIPTRYLPQMGCESPLEKGRNVDWEMCFLGTVNEKKYWHKGRKEVLDYILNNDINLKLITGEKDTRDQSWIYNQSKYSLAMSFPMVGGSSNRLFNILSSGGFAITKHFPEIELLFKKGVHLEWFEHKEQIVEIVKYYNKNPKKYDKIKLNSLILYHSKHTAKHRMQNALDYLENRTKDFYGYL